MIANGEMDVISDLAIPVPGWVIADMLGVSRDMQPKFTQWSRDQVRVYDRPGTSGERIPIMRQGQESMLEMKAYLEGVIADRRIDPHDDLITMLVMAEEEGDRLSTDELVIMIIALLVGGNNSTAHLIGNAVFTLARHPDALATAQSRPESDHDRGRGSSALREPGASHEPSGAGRDRSRRAHDRARTGDQSPLRLGES